ncbi:MAG: flagellar filament capping protein FliD, partial [Gemmatimonadaceae bacterium]
TIGGEVATGNGQILSATPPITGQPTDGLGVTYTGTALGAIGDLVFTLGLAGTLFNTSDAIAAPNGTVFLQTEALNKSITELGTRADTLQQVLDRKRAALVKQFTAMETAISRIQQQGTSLTSFLNSLNARSN